MPDQPTRDEIRKAITDAYYETRNAGGTMETAADSAAAAVVELHERSLAGAVLMATGGGPPACEDHRERQHRDGKAPWCPHCGWNRGTPAVAAQRLGTPKSQR